MLGPTFDRIILYSKSLFIVVDSSKQSYKYQLYILLKSCTKAMDLHPFNEFNFSYWPIQIQVGLDDVKTSTLYQYVWRIKWDTT